MPNPERPCKEPYTEAEAAEALGITIARLHQILDQHIFNQAYTRPNAIEFTANDLLLLSVWNHDSMAPSEGRLLRMPKRK